jgi:hypothetical protein
MVQMKKVAEIRARWEREGRPRCMHESVDKEYDLGGDTGDYACTTCGITWSRNREKPPPEPADSLPAADDLLPKNPVPGVPTALQAESMRLLRRMRRAPKYPQELADQMAAWALSNSLSREDMAVATELTLDQVNKIIRETAERDRDLTTHALRERVARHMPPEMRDST